MNPLSLLLTFLTVLLGLPAGVYLAVQAWQHPWGALGWMVLLVLLCMAVWPWHKRWLATQRRP